MNKNEGGYAKEEADAVLILIRNILHDVGNFAVQNPAKHVNGVGADAFVSL